MNLSKTKRFDQARLDKYIELAVYGKNANPRSISDPAGLRRVAVVLTTKCNLECVWCHREEQTIKDSGYLENEMSFEKLEELLPKLRGFQLIHFGGLGEPFLYKRIFDAISLAKNYVPIVKVTTNGTPLVNVINSKISESGIDILEVSIDGFDGKTNQKFRGVDEDVIIKKLTKLSIESSIAIQVNIVVSENNIDGLYDAVDKLSCISNLSIIHTIPLFMTEHMKELEIGRASVERYQSLLDHLRGRIQKLGLSVKLDPDEVYMDPVITLKQQRNICFTPYEDVMINVQGNIVPCGRLQHYNLGSIYDVDELEEIWNGSKMIAWRKSQLDGDYCVDCMRECDMKNTKRKTHLLKAV